MEKKYKIGEWVFHRYGDEIKHGKIVGYDNDCYVIETLVDDIFGYMHLKDEDISKNYEELKNCNIMEVKIKQGNEMLDATIEMVDGVMVVSPKEVMFEPKDGDVIIVRSLYKHILIYKESKNGYLYSFADLINDLLYIDDTPVCREDDINEIRPATEEEKKKLFDKLSEEGYEFDFEKKERVKLRWKPGLGEKYYYPYLSDFNSSPDSFTWANDETDECMYARGWCFKTVEECQEFCNRLNQAIEGVKP